MIHTGLIANDYKQTDDFHLLLKTCSYKRRYSELVYKVWSSSQLMDAQYNIFLQTSWDNTSRDY